MRFIVLGSAAGGGLPQWNCLCPNCRLAWEHDARVPWRSQASVAASADGENWVLLGASPDLRQQILAAPALHPKRAPRHSPIRGVFAPNGDVDNIAGLLTMREMQPFTLWATAATLSHLSGGVFGVLDPRVVQRQAVALEEVVDTGAGFTLTAFVVPGKIPLYMEAGGDGEIELGVEGETTVGLEIVAAGRRFYYLPSCARITDRLRRRLAGAEIVFFDGTTFEDDEMIRLGLSEKTAWRMGHMAMNGPQGSMAALADVRVGRRVYIHINNSNPVLRSDSAERRAVEAAGWEVAFDGMEIEAASESSRL
jgi:pyrroloquinoline quinone biosynthesis protein B